MYTVTINKKQAEAIEHVISKYEREYIVRNHVESRWEKEETKCLNELSLDELNIAIYCGYKEV